MTNQITQPASDRELVAAILGKTERLLACYKDYTDQRSKWKDLLQQLEQAQKLVWDLRNVMGLAERGCIELPEHARTELAERECSARTGFKNFDCAREQIEECLGSYRDEVQDVIDKLCYFLPNDQIQRLKSVGIVDPYQALQTAKAILEPLLQSLREAEGDARIPEVQHAGQVRPAVKTTSRGRQRSNEPPRRAPDIKTSKERTDRENYLRGKLTKVCLLIRKGKSLSEVKNAHPDLDIWKKLSREQEQELEAEDFKPKRLARELVLEEFGITSDATLKKDRSKLRAAKSKDRTR